MLYLVIFIKTSSDILPRKFYFRIPLVSGGITHGIGQVRFTNIGWTFGVAAGGDSGQLNRGEFFQLPPHRYWNNSNTVVMVNALSVPFFMGKNKYLKYLNDLSRGRYFL